MRAQEPFLSRANLIPSAVVLILANLIPLGGVVFLDWSAFNIVFLFWLENVVMGVFNVIKMLVYGALGSFPEEKRVIPRIAQFAGSLFLGVFFTFHYGMFCYVHGIFVFALLGDGLHSGTHHGNPMDLPAQVRAELNRGLGTALAALVISHGFSFWMNYIRNREYKRISSGLLMAAPYGRVVVLHVAIILGAFAIHALHSPSGLVALLVVFKIGLDLSLHLKERDLGSINLVHLVTRRKANPELENPDR